jgi:pimeloyl-ACP methyl ester carboxylesterase
MADYLLSLEREGAAIAAIQLPRHIPVVVISSGDQPQEYLDAHRRLAAASSDGRHVIAARSAHWVQFDEPELVIGVIKDLVEQSRSLDGPTARVRS